MEHLLLHYAAIHRAWGANNMNSLRGGREGGGRGEGGRCRLTITFYEKFWKIGFADIELAKMRNFEKQKHASHL